MFDGELLQDALDERSWLTARLHVEALSTSGTHSFSKHGRAEIRLLEGLGVEGDAHCAATDQHLFRGRADAPPNLRQLHLLSAETLDTVHTLGFSVAPGALGENILTRGIELTSLPQATLLRFSSGAVARLTGRRTPCRLIDRLGPGLMKALGGERGARWGENAIAGVMAVIVHGGLVRPGEPIVVEPPAPPHAPLAPL